MLGCFTERTCSMDGIVRGTVRSQPRNHSAACQFHSKKNAMSIWYLFNHDAPVENPQCWQFSIMTLPSILHSNYVLYPVPLSLIH
jgi:hypothetical protein